MSHKHNRMLTSLHISEDPNYATPTMPESPYFKKRRLDRKRKAISHYLLKLSNTVNNSPDVSQLKSKLRQHQHHANLSFTAKEQICEIDCHQHCMAYVHDIRSYNSVFAFTSLEANVDKTLANFKHGIYTFHIQDALYHLIGSLLPESGNSAQFA
ncbi:12311_t:CDS:2 [Cetraspora pellucida]|uniref:12311_t:CDS:1 n=1 Tax=Cetraspora pellucida TaxID=1433469 RepID=A0ACA9MB87_9GLOM|nr:12311_t:CDS:2 [Cetraspora pellucida]